MGYAINELRVVGVGREATFGNVGTIHKWIPATSVKFDLGLPIEESKEITNLRESRRTFSKIRTLSGDVTFPLGVQRGQGVIARCFFGTSSVAQAGGAAGGTAYRHTFTVREDANVDSMFARVVQFGTSTYDYVGLVPSKLSYDIPKDGECTLAVTFIGKNELTGTVNSGTFGTFNTYTSGANAQVFLDNTANADITNIKIDIENGAKAVMAVGTNNTLSNIAYGAVKVSGQFDIAFNNEAERTKFLNKTQTSIQAKMVGVTLFGTAKAETVITMPKVEYASVPFADVDGVIGATVAFISTWDSNAYGTGAVIVNIQNLTSAY